MVLFRTAPSALDPQTPLTIVVGVVHTRTFLRVWWCLSAVPFIRIRKVSIGFVVGSACLYGGGELVHVGAELVGFGVPSGVAG